jgi:hypothetical protein
MPPKAQPAATKAKAEAKKKTCFVIMPITTHHLEAYGGDQNHFRTVYSHLFVPAIESLGLEPHSPIVKGTKFIQGEIVRQLLNADMVLCDMSSYNPNVFLELGIRIAASKPMCLVVDDVTAAERLPFDTSHLNHMVYKSNPGYDVESQRKVVTEHIRSTMDDPQLGIQLWREWALQSAMAKPAEMSTPADSDQVNFIMEKLRQIVLQAQAGPRHTRDYDWAYADSPSPVSVDDLSIERLTAWILDRPKIEEALRSLIGDIILGVPPGGIAKTLVPISADDDFMFIARWMDLCGFRGRTVSVDSVSDKQYACKVSCPATPDNEKAAEIGDSLLALLVSRRWPGHSSASAPTPPRPAASPRHPSPPSQTLPAPPAPGG